jgi:cell division septation protein DedD
LLKKEEGGKPMRPESEEWETGEEEMDLEELPERPQRRIPSRRSRRSRSRKTSFGFGHFMLPIVGLVAVGVLVLGIRLFFFPSGGVEPPPADVQQTERNVSGSVQEGNSVPESGETIVAVPEGAPLPKTDPAQKPIPAQEKTPVKPVPVKVSGQGPAVSEPPASPPGTETVKSTSKTGTETTGKETWGVQVGAFKERMNAENLVKKLKQEGFAAGLVETGGAETVLAKVVVQAGNDRPSAERLAKMLSDKGYPVLIVRVH